MSKASKLIMDNCDPSLPEWKKELIRRKMVQMRTLIRLPSVLIERERNLSMSSQPSSTALTNNDLHADSGNTQTTIRLTRDEIGNLVKLKPAVNHCSASHGAPYPATSSGYQMSVGKMPQMHNNFVRSNNVEHNAIRERPLQLNGDGGKASVTNRKLQPCEASNDVLQVSNHRKGNACPVADGTVTSLPLNKLMNRSKEMLRDDAAENKSVGITNEKVNMVSAKNDLNHESTPDFFGIDELNGNEESFAAKNIEDCDYDYRPGIVNRLKAKFITLALQGTGTIQNSMISPTSPFSPVRRVVSEEHLLDVISDDEHFNFSLDGLAPRGGFVDQKKCIYEKNGNVIRSAQRFSNGLHSKNMKRANSVDNLLVLDRSPKDFLTSKKIIIIEQPKAATKNVTVEIDVAKKSSHPIKSPMDLSRNSSPILANSDEFPVPNIVRECKKLFEQPEDSKNGLANAGVPTKTSKTKQCTISIPTGVVLPKPTVANKPVQLSAVDGQLIESDRPKSPNKVMPSTEPAIQTSRSPETETNTSIKERIEIFSSLTKSQPVKPLFPSASVIDAKVENPATASSVDNQNQNDSFCTFQQEPLKVITENEPSPPHIPIKESVINHAFVDQQKIPISNHSSVHSISETLPSNGTGSVKLRSSYHQEGNSVIFDFIDDHSKPRPPHLPDIKPVPPYSPDPIIYNAGCSKLDGSDEDESDGCGDINYSKSIVFIGANVIVGRSSLLKTRNKKLQLIFDDKAVSTYEYPSELTLLGDKSDSDDCDDNDSTFCDINKPNNLLRQTESAPDYDFVPKKPISSVAATSGGCLGSYTPMAVSSDQGFELGISRAPQSAAITTNSSQNSKVEPFDDENVALSIKPAADDENVLWSSTQTSDILF